MPKSTVLEFLTKNPNLIKMIKRLSSVYLLLLIVVISAGYFYFRSVKKIIVNERENDLSIIAELKVSQITNWRQERLASAFSLAPFYIDAEKINILLQTGDMILRQEMFCKWTKDIHVNPEYEGIYLYDPSLKEIAFGCSGGENVPLGAYEKSEAKRALEEKKIIFSDIYRNEFNHSIDLDIYVPVFEVNVKKGTKAFGLIVLKINPYKFLYPFMQVSPGSSKTCETYMVRKEDGGLLYLNELKFLKDSALTASVHSGKGGYLSALVEKGVTGIAEGIDYRDIPVLAAIRNVPDSSWILIAKIDRDEARAPVIARAAYIILFSVIVVVGIGAWLGFIWYRQLASVYRRQVEHKVLTRKYDYIIKYANDIIIILNNDLRIVEANDKAITSYQYPSNEFLQMNLKDLHTPETLPALYSELEVIAKKGNQLFKTVHRRKDGSTFPVEVSMQHYVIEWSEFYQAIIRDTSERNKICP